MGRARAALSSAVVLLAAACGGSPGTGTGTSSQVSGNTPRARADSLVSILEAMPAVTGAEVSFIEDSDYYTVLATLARDASAGQVEAVVEELDRSADEVDPELGAAASVTLGSANAEIEDADPAELAELVIQLGGLEAGKIRVADPDPIELTLEEVGEAADAADAVEQIAALQIPDVHSVQVYGIGVEAVFDDGVTDQEAAAWRAMLEATALHRGYDVWGIFVNPSMAAPGVDRTADHVEVQVELDRPLPRRELTRQRLQPLLWPMIRDLRTAVADFADGMWLAVGVRGRDLRTTWVVDASAAEITRGHWTS